MFRFNVLCTAALALTICAPAEATPIVMNCRAVEVQGMPADWREVDRVEIDETRSMITFAVSRTLGTADEKAWTFGATKDAMSYDQIVLERFEATLRIAALRLGSPTAIWVEPSLVRLATLNKFGVELAKFACHAAER